MNYINEYVHINFRNLF